MDLPLCILQITVGTDQRGQTARNFDTYNLWWKYRKNNPMVINYHDGDQQYGQVRIYYQSGKYVVELHDLSFPGCDGEVIQITFEGWTTAFTCPLCFRNIGCGLMGKYTRGGTVCIQMRDVLINFLLKCWRFTKQGISHHETLCMSKLLKSLKQNHFCTLQH